MASSIIFLLAVVASIAINLYIAHITKKKAKSSEKTYKELGEILEDLEQHQSDIREIILANKIEGVKHTLETRQALSDAINEKMLSLMNTINDLMRDDSERTNSLHKDILSAIGRMDTSSKESQIEMAKSLSEALDQIRRMNEQKLNEINASVSEKLDKSLNERLDSSFKQVGEQLGDLYKSLGELHNLSSGVTDLNKTLSNVKTRGIFGEQQLASILENTMTPAQYETNVAVKKNSSDFVEFAIKIPSKTDDKEFIMLPIDSKFPTDIYNKIVAASEQGDAAMLTAATKELEQRIKQEARTIRDKYINPPVTTDFAVMFLPTESMYSEVLRINGLTEWCQTNCKIIISGPTTITALLNSLRVGFSNLTLNKKTQEVIKVLQAVKTQYSTLSDLIDKTQKKLSDATKSTEDLRKRTEIIRSRMGKIEELEQSEAEKILALEEE